MLISYERAWMWCVRYVTTKSVRPVCIGSNHFWESLFLRRCIQDCRLKLIFGFCFESKWSKHGFLHIFYQISNIRCSRYLLCWISSHIQYMRRMKSLPSSVKRATLLCDHHLYEDQSARNRRILLTEVKVFLECWAFNREFFLQLTTQQFQTKIKT